MTNYLFVSDLDGTLLDSSKRVSERTGRALEDFVGRGGRFAICTGRDINSARSVFEGLGLELPGSHLIAYNGGHIVEADSGKTVYRLGIQKETALLILALGKELGVHVQGYNDHFVLTTDFDECSRFYRRVIKTPVIVADDISSYMDVPPCKLLAIELDDADKLENFRVSVTERFGDEVKAVYSSRLYLEIIPKNSGKGQAVTELAGVLGIGRENVIAAGDEDNDISMLEAAGIGVAMKNANERVKAKASVITEHDNDHDGLADILLHPERYRS